MVHLYDLLLEQEPSPSSRSTGRRRWRSRPAPTRASPSWTGSAADPRLTGYPYLPAARADLLRRLGRSEDAASAYAAAIELTTNAAELEFLRHRLAELAAPAATHE